MTIDPLPSGGPERRRGRNSTHTGSSGTEAIVPTAVFPILCAMFVLLLIQHAVVLTSDIAIWVPMGPNQYPLRVIDLATEPIDPSVHLRVLMSLARSATRHA